MRKHDARAFDPDEDERVIALRAGDQRRLRTLSRLWRACAEMLTLPAEQDTWLASVATTISAP